MFACSCALRSRMACNGCLGCHRFLSILSQARFADRFRIADSICRDPGVKLRVTLGAARTARKSDGVMDAITTPNAAVTTTRPAADAIAAIERPP